MRRGIELEIKILKHEIETRYKEIFKCVSGLTITEASNYFLLDFINPITNKKDFLEIKSEIMLIDALEEFESPQDYIQYILSKELGLIND